MSDADESREPALPLSGPGEPAPEPPQVDDYEIIEWLGEGGMGTVWRARQLSTDRVVALKVMSQRALRSKGNVRSRFEREVTLAASLEHPNIARVYESGIRKSHHFYAMELIDGKPLDEYVRQQKLSVPGILELMHRVCLAVQYAHQRSIIHRDLKPSNILVTSDGQPHVLDFGLARSLVSEERTEKLSTAGDVMGTYEYMSPEQAAGDVKAIDKASDVYSLGIILYHLLTGDWPYDVTGRDYRVLERIREQEPARPSEKVPGFDRDLEALLLKALAKSPKERYGSAGELSDDIQQWLAGWPVSARSIDTWYLLRKFVARNRVAVSVASLVTIIILSSGFIGIFSYSQARSAFRELESRELDYKQGVRENAALLNRTAFRLFLEFWSASDARAEGFRRFFPEKSREFAAACFLLDARPIDERRVEFGELFSGKHRSFGHFIMGEWFLRNGEAAKATEEYRACFQDGHNPEDPDEWFVDMAEERLARLPDRAPRNHLR